MNPIRTIELLALSTLAAETSTLAVAYNKLEDAQAMVDLQLVTSNEILPVTGRGERVDEYLVTVDVKKVLKFVEDAENFKAQRKGSTTSD